MKIRYYLICLLFVANGVLAQGFYTELAVGEAKQQTETKVFGTYTGQEISLGLQVGYQFLPYMAAELGYSDYGSVSDKKAGIKATMSTTAINTGIRFILPLGVWVALYAKTGIAWWDYEYKPAAVRATSKTGKDFYYGAGAKFNLNEIFALGLEYQRFSMDIDKNTLDAKHKVDNMALTFSVMF